MSAIDWLQENAPGFRDLTGEERNAIMHFSLLWSLFEAKALNTDGIQRKREYHKKIERIQISI